MTLAGSSARRALWGVLLLAAWAVAAHLASTGVGPADLRLAVALAPLLATGVAVAWQSPWQGAPALGTGAVVLGLTIWAWPHLRGDVAWIYCLQHLGAHLVIAAWFGCSLLPGRDPIVTAMTRMIFGDQLSPRQERYTRGVTWAWALFLVGNALVSSALFALAPADIWSFHANLLTAPLVGAVFLLEMLVRRQILPAAERPALRDVARVVSAQFQRTGSANQASQSAP